MLKVLKRLLALLTSRSVVVISTTCAILYTGFWGVGALQASRLTPALPAQTASSEAAMPAGAGPASGLTLEIQASASVEPWVLNGTGEGVGVNPNTGLVRLEAPGASYSGKGTSPQAIAIPNAAGEYRILLRATNDGPFQLHVRMYRGTDASTAREYTGSGQAQAKSTLECDVSVAPNKSALDVTPIRFTPESPTGSR